MVIRLGDLRDPRIIALLQEHLREMKAASPPESVHALDLEELEQRDVTFWAVWEGDSLLTCGALKQRSPDHGEIKSMRTSAGHRGRGMAAMMLRHIIAEALHRGYRRLSLETGSMAYFEPAIALYRKFGFEPCKPFADYTLDPNSVYLTKLL